MERNTESSTGTERVKRVEVPLPDMATCFAAPLMAGPAGFSPVTEASPGCSEMRVVEGVQLAALWQVSRTKTWRKPLFVPEVDCAEGSVFAA